MNSSDDEPQVKTAQRRRKPINKKTKLHIKFNEDARREFLTGFRKRKLQRKKAAQEEFEKLLKEEKKRIKSEAKEQYKKFVKSYKPIPELEKTLAKEYDVDDSKVSVLELDTDLLAETNFMIGRNKAKYEEIENNDHVEPLRINQREEAPEIEGMELKETKEDVPVASKKELQKMVMRQAGEIVKNSKLFQKKNQMERVKQKKMEARKKKAKKKVKSKKQKRGKKK